jgi:hypothetical protein
MQKIGPAFSAAVVTAGALVLQGCAQAPARTSEVDPAQQKQGHIDMLTEAYLFQTHDLAIETAKKVERNLIVRNHLIKLDGANRESCDALKELVIARARVYTLYNKTLDLMGEAGLLTTPNIQFLRAQLRDLDDMIVPKTAVSKEMCAARGFAIDA